VLGAAWVLAAVYDVQYTSNISNQQHL